MGTTAARGYPFGFESREQFEGFGSRIKAFLQENGYPTDDIRVQGSSIIKNPPNDIDIGIVVSPRAFDDLIAQSFSSPNPGSSKEKTMLHAMDTGKITARYCRPRLSPLHRELTELLGKDVQISIIRRGGPFDHGMSIRIQ